ncbi:hypothetical protein Rsub_03384 [Raphidocelis subcapitata]|uniref:MYND-type domain-containing protein n=1 Tax=Raphidocelis subcapitata TaxID=307507 RepID=A0A2V0NRK0_9CHLO|nr:hypothetical protein Rsub_03384 [Raphidocelis subcapitata]|eukprot:GBF90251.1 hypothetical protein Rsub_03384 [Raphidocelis subcapitata]
MAETAAVAAAALRRQRLAAQLQHVDAALRGQAQSPGLPPEVQELASSWDVRARAVLDAAGSAEGGLQGVAATAVAELLQPLLGGAFAAACPELCEAAIKAASTIMSQCCSTEGLPSLFGPVAASLLDLVLNEQLSWQTRNAAAEPLAELSQPGCAAALLAAPGAEGAVEALIAAAQREGDGEGDQEDIAFAVLASLAEADDATAERVGSAAAALLPAAAERVRGVAADGPPTDILLPCPFHAVRLLGALTSAASDAVRLPARAVPGLADAAAGLLMALAAVEARALQDVWHHDAIEERSLSVLSNVMGGAPSICATACDALTSRGALPRVVALLRSSSEATRMRASCVLALFVHEEEGTAALLQVPRAASELAAALRRAYAAGEDPAMTQCYAALALSGLLGHSGGQRVAAGLARAAAAEGSAGSLLGALAGLIVASVAEGSAGSPDLDTRWRMCVGGAAVLNYVLLVSIGTSQQLRLLRQVPRLAEACARALEHWVEIGGSDERLEVAAHLAFVLAAVAGLGVNQTARGNFQPPAPTADTAAARAALRRAPGLAGTLQRFVEWHRRQHPEAEPVKKVGVMGAMWLLRLPEFGGLAAAPPTPAAAAVASAAAAVAAPAPAAAAPATSTEAGLGSTPATAALVQAPATAAAALELAAAGGRSAAAQPLAPEAGSRGSRADVASSSSGDRGGGSSSGGGGGGGGEAAERPRECGACGRSAAEVALLRCVGCKARHYCGDACAKADWSAHRAACKAARRAASKPG